MIYKKIYIILLLTAILLLGYGYYRYQHQAIYRRGNGEQAALKIALDWNNNILELDRYAEGYRSPVSARMWAYTQLAVWEAVLPGMPDRRSVISDLHGPALPVWKESRRFILPVALMAAYERMTERFFYHVPATIMEKNRQYVRDTYAHLLSAYSGDGFRESRQYGEAVADAIFKWSASDSLGHMGHMFNYEKNYRPVEGEDKWKPDEFLPMPPLLPFWGGTRTLLVDTGEIRVHPPLPYSISAGSPFYAQAMEVYTNTLSTTEEKKWIAEFWADDIPGTTFTGASRWISIANQVIIIKKADFKTAMETWLKTALALHDAGVNVWKWKYEFSMQRPSSYIRQHISPDWQPIRITPPFPAYPSGHAAFGAAAVAVIANIYGNDMYIRDLSHSGRKEFRSQSRAFGSLDEMAKENAFSRILVGAHFRMDCEEGIRVGKLIGERINDLQTKKLTPIIK